jgi:AcrR family transcriptional regulator
MARKTEVNPKGRILDAAEKMFAEAGFDGASLRDIVREAGVNLATVYYYFESKEGLIAAVIERRLGPLRQEHLDLLHQHEEAANGRPVPLENIFEAVLLPPLRLVGANTAQSKAVSRLLGRIVTEPNPQFQDLLRSQHEKVRNAFLEALRRTLPHLPTSDLQWRIEFLWGALAFILCNPRKIEKMSRGACNPADTPALMSQMMRFFTAGFSAPPASSP